MEIAAGIEARDTPSMLTGFPVIHVVTDSTSLLLPGFSERAEKIMRALGTRGALHLRSSRLSGRSFHGIAARLAEVQTATGCWLIVNDRVDIARAVGARGIQLAAHSLRISDALTVAPDIPVGASIHSVDEARKSESEGAAWCVAGTVFETPSHEGRPPAQIQFIAQVVAAVRIPVIAIGGIAPSDVGALRAAGAHGIATIRGAVWDCGADAIPGPAAPTQSSGLPLTYDDADEPVARYISAYDADDG
ncbi:MAG: thiamine phosphate synthase, partial [Gemmatimonadaceae bacterium]